MFNNKYKIGFLSILVGLAGCNSMPFASETTQSPSSMSEQTQQAAPERRSYQEPSQRNYQEPRSTQQVAALPAEMPIANQQNTATDFTVPIQPGECWMYAKLNAKQARDSVDVVIQDSRTKLTITPAEFKKGYKTVVTKEGTKTYRVLPATYKQIEERVMVRPETTELVVDPAVYRETRKTVVLEEEHTVLKPCKSSVSQYIDGVAGMSVCSEVIPAKTQDVVVKELVTPEQTRTVVVPPQYKTFLKWVIDQPAQVFPVEVDQDLSQVEVDELLRGTRAVQEFVPAERQTFEVTKYTSQPKIVARRILCDKDITETLMARLQRVLQNQGLYSGEVDGLIGRQTVLALNTYQARNGLAVGGITLETLEHMGLR